MLLKKKMQFMEDLINGKDNTVPEVLRNYLIAMTELDVFQEPDYAHYIQILDAHKIRKNAIPSWEKELEFVDVKRKYQKTLQPNFISSEEEDQHRASYNHKRGPKEEMESESDENDARYYKKKRGGGYGGRYR